MNKVYFYKNKAKIKKCNLCHKHFKSVDGRPRACDPCKLARKTSHAYEYFQSVKGCDYDPVVYLNDMILDDLDSFDYEHRI